MHIYPGDTPFFVYQEKTLHKDGLNLSRLEMGSHNGTHIDAPYHFIADGAPTEALPLDALVGPAWVADCTDVTPGKGITVEKLEALPWDGRPERVLFKTQNSDLWKRDYFQQTRYVFLTPEAAQWLAERGVRCVGIDYLSIEKFGAKSPDAHLALLKAGAIVIEGLDLSDAGGNRAYTLACLPLKIPGIDGAPARAVLIE
jgi:arylformamidase